MKNVLISIVLLLALAGCDNKPANTAPHQISWEDLIPEGYSAEELVEKYLLDTYAVDDPRRDVLIEALEREWALAPVNEDLDGKTVTLTGYIVPLEMDSIKVSEFLLVPFLGACVHVPPPPPNQLVYVKMAEAIEMPNGYEAFSVTGLLEAETVTSDLAEAGYRLAGVSVEEVDLEVLFKTDEDVLEFE